MQRPRWLVGVLASLVSSLVLSTLASGQIPPIDLPPELPREPLPGAESVLEAQQPFIARYAYCNAMQMYQGRRAAWEPIYRDAGASSADLDAYSGDLVTYIKEFCANGRPPRYWQEALARVEAFDDRVDRAMAASLGIAIEDAAQLRISRLLEQLEQLRARCLGAGPAASLEDLVSVFGSLLPATEQPFGMTLDRGPAAASMGKCGPDGGSGGSSVGGRGFDRATLGACVASALEQSSSCVTPVGDPPGDSAVVRREGTGPSCAPAGASEVCTTKVHNVYANGAYVDEETRRTRSRGLDGREHEIVTQQRRTIGSDGELVSDLTSIRYDGRYVGFTGTGDRDVDGGLHMRESVAEAFGLEITVPANHRPVVESFLSRARRVRGPPESTGGPSAGRRRRDSCVAVNPESSQSLGFARTVASDEGTASPVPAGRLDTWDLVGQCVCNSLGRLGPQLAANSGFSCGPDENSRRLDCLLNPRGPADGIRPECVRYLQEDNPGRDTRTTLAEWCGRVAQCPPGAARVSTSETGGALCSCGTGLATPRGGRGSAQGGGMCATVSCAQGPGAAGADLYGQCCSVPGESPFPLDPSKGPPVPPRPGPPEDPKRAPQKK